MTLRLVLVGLAVCGGLFLAALLPSAAYAQETPATDTLETRERPVRADSLRPAADTVRSGTDTLRTSPSARQAAADTSRGQRGTPTGRQPGAAASSDQGGASFTARDSLVITTDSAGVHEGRLYGESEMNYEQANLRARVITVDFRTDDVKAEGPPSDTARFSRPTFKRGDQDAFTGDVLSFNLQTKRGRVVAARTDRQEGFIQGKAVKVYEDSTVFVQDGLYTTCDCEPDETPAYSLRSNQMKVKDQWVYTGPIQLFLYNVPTPLWLPFGMLPATEGRRSGPLPPEYGTDSQGRGLYLRNWGWYFAMNDYMDLQLRAGIYSQGSFWIEPTYRYTKRYSYSGNLRVRFERTRIGEKEDPDFTDQREGRLQWRHDQEINPTSSFGANVDLTTRADAVRRNAQNFNEAVRQEVSSSLRYQKRWGGGARRFSITGRQRQNLADGSVSATLPDLSFSQNSFKPFERESRIGDERWFERITTQYSLTVQNSYSFNPRDPEQLRERGETDLADSLEAADIQWYEALFDRQKYELATGNDQPYDFQATHNVPLNANFRLNRYNLNISPRVSYSSEWYVDTVRKVAIDTTDADTSETFSGRQFPTEQETTPGFYARHDFSTSLSFGSEVFGTFPVGVGKFQGLRHRTRPSISMQYQPNFNDPLWGRTRVLRKQNGEVVRDENGEPIRYDILNGSNVGGSNEQRRLSFSLDNTLETKRVETDTTGQTDSETIQLLDFGVDTGYNFAADSLKLSDIGFDARTRYDFLNFQVGMTFSPYRSVREPSSTGGRARFTVVDEYMAEREPWNPIRLTQFRTTISGSLNGGRRSGGSGSRQRQQRQTDQRRSGGVGGVPETPVEGRETAFTSEEQTDTRLETGRGYPTFGIPWDLSFDFNYSFRKPGKRIENPNASVGLQFSLSPTPNWDLRGQTGYDFVRGELSTTNLSVGRNLGCWVMSFSWRPFGEFQSYSFSLRVRSGQLSQLLNLQVPRRDDGRFGGFGSQLRGTAQGFAGQGGGSFGGGGF